MNTNNLRDDSITSLILKFSIPAIIGMVVNAVYNIVDRIFIGKYVGEEALASLMVVFPIILFIFAISILIGQGGSNLISIRLGERKEEDANKVFTNTIFLNLIVIVLFASTSLLFLDEILTTLGISGLVFDYAKTYLGIYLMFTPISITSFILSTIVRAEGFPKLSMTAMIGSGLTNIVLDYFFIGVFGWGVAGGALATGLGQSLGFFILLNHFVMKKSKLHITKENIGLDFKVVKEIFTIGFPSFLSTLGVSAFMLVLNYSLNLYGGVPAVTAMAAINSLFTIIIMPINGVQGGIQPIIGYNHGAKLHSRVRETLKKAILFTICFSTIAFLFLEAIPAPLLGMFIDSSSETMEVAIVGLRIFVLSLPLLCVSILSISYFQATQKPKIAITLGILRQFVLLIPLLIILPKYLGLLGVWLAVPIADYIGIVISATLVKMDFKKAEELINIETIELA